MLEQAEHARALVLLFAQHQVKRAVKVALRTAARHQCVMVEGLDETTMQPMQARRSWPPEAILMGYRYVDLLSVENGETHIDYTKFNEVVPL